MLAFSLVCLGFYDFILLSTSSEFCSDCEYAFFNLNKICVSIVSLDLSIDFFGFILLILAYLVGSASLASLDTRLSKSNFRFFNFFSFFLAFVYIFVLADDLMVFFLAYELLLLPSFFFLYFISYSKKAVQASLYFVV